VAADATRLVSRFNRDWMIQGRRPAGICGACILLAARMNNFRRSVEEIVQVVKIADTTLKKRLDEFRKTPSGQLTLADFRQVWLEEEADPPAFTKGNEREEKEKKKKAKKGKRRKRGHQSDEDEEELEYAPEEQDFLPPQPKIDPALFNTGILAGTVEPAPLFLPEVEMSNIDPALLPPTDQPPSSPLEQVVNEAVMNEVSSFLEHANGVQVMEALDEAEERRLTARTLDDELADLDDAELDEFILTEDEVKIKERVWVEMNREYLEAIAGEPKFVR
jgi:transcription factor IIIB subunit 2